MRPESMREDDILAETSRRDDIKLAASKIAGAKRRGFQTAMAVKHWGGQPAPNGGRIRVEPPVGGAAAARAAYALGAALPAGKSAPARLLGRA
jgi:hypothetical protein